MFYENHIAKLTLKSCEGKVAVEKASIVYKQEITAMNEPLGLPRNVQQLRNLRFRVMIPNACHMIPCIIYMNLDMICQEDNDPSWPGMCMWNAENARRIWPDTLDLLGNCGQVLSYDTAFQLGDFYVSSLIFDIFYLWPNLRKGSHTCINFKAM